MTQAMQFDEIGGPEVLTLREIAEPTPGPGQVLVHTTAIGVNPLDWKLRSGVRPLAPGTGPHGSGQDGAGVIRAIGAGVEGFRVGDPVAFASASGAYATDVVVSAAWASPLPSNVTPAQGAAVGIPAGTAYQVVRSLAISASDTVVVHGGSGSVGQFVIQFARVLGATVVATASPRRASLVESLGASAVAYGGGVTERLSAAAPDGYTVAIDCAGTDEALQASLDLVADRSRIATIVRGADADGLGIRAFSGGSPRPLTETELGWRREALPVTLALMSAGTVRVDLGASYALADAGRAQQDSQDGHPGKLILIP